MLTHRGPGTRKIRTGLRPPQYKRFGMDLLLSSCRTPAAAPLHLPADPGHQLHSCQRLLFVDPDFPAASDCQGQLASPLRQRSSLWRLWQRAGWLDQPDSPGHQREYRRSWYTLPLLTVPAQDRFGFVIKHTYLVEDKFNWQPRFDRPTLVNLPYRITISTSCPKLFSTDRFRFHSRLAETDPDTCLALYQVFCLPSSTYASLATPPLSIHMSLRVSPQTP